MRKGFDVRDQSYEAELSRLGEGEDGFAIYGVSVRGPDGRPVEGTLKLTDTALAVAEHLAAARGGAAEEWLVRGCARSLSAEIALRPLRPGFCLVVDHRWITERKSATAT